MLLASTLTGPHWLRLIGLSPCRAATVHQHHLATLPGPGLDQTAARVAPTATLVLRRAAGFFIMLQLQPKAGEWNGIRDALQSSDRYFRLTMAMDSNSNEQESKQTAEAFKWVAPAGLVTCAAAGAHVCVCSTSLVQLQVPAAHIGSLGRVCCSAPMCRSHAPSSAQRCSTWSSPDASCS